MNEYNYNNYGKFNIIFKRKLVEFNLNRYLFVFTITIDKKNFILNNNELIMINTLINQFNYDNINIPIPRFSYSNANVFETNGTNIYLEYYFDSDIDFQVLDKFVNDVKLAFPKIEDVLLNSYNRDETNIDFKIIVKANLFTIRTIELVAAIYPNLLFNIDKDRFFNIIKDKAKQYELICNSYEFDNVDGIYDMKYIFHLKVNKLNERVKIKKKIEEFKEYLNNNEEITIEFDKCLDKTNVKIV